MIKGNFQHEEHTAIQRILDGLEARCEDLSINILNRMSWRVIRKIKKQMASSDIDDGLAKLGMDILDQMSIYHQTRTYEEFLFGFDDYLNEVIQAEIDRIPEIEQLILEHRDICALSKGEMGNKIFADVKKAVSSIIDQHYYTSRIQRFVERYNLHG